MKKTLFGFIWRYSARQQIVIVAITVMSFPLVYMSLDLPKRIVNDALQGKNFPRHLFGFELNQLSYLFLLCMAFLALVVANNGVKYVLNVYKGVVGERMLRRLRYQLYSQVLRFRPTHFRRVSSGELIPMITAEVEDLGTFIGDSVAQPAFQGGTLLVYIFFIFMQDPWLGLASISLYPIQAVVIPRLQKRVIYLSRERIKNVRRISDRIGESVSGAIEMHAHGTSGWHLANISDRLYENYLIRFEIYKRKYLIKFVNNFMNQLPPFFFYLIGGYLVLRGQISFGALVAVLTAYKDLASPWNELLTYYQDLANVSVKYETIVENFDPPEIYPTERMLEHKEGEAEAAPLQGDLALVSATGGSTVQNPEVRDVSLTIAQGRHVAVVGDDSSGRTEALQMLAGLLPPSVGRVEVGGRTLDGQPETVLGVTIGYASSSPYIFNDTIRTNVLYGLRHRPVGPPRIEASELRRRQNEAAATESTLYEFDAPWDDVRRAGLEDPAELEDAMIALLESVGLREDLYRVGLQARIRPEDWPDLVEMVISARRALRDRIEHSAEVSDLVELWDPEKTNRSATVAENILFALPADANTPVGAIPQDPLIMRFLDDAGLTEDMIDLGVTVAETMIELFSTMRGDDDFVGAYSFLSADELPAYEARVKKVRASGAKSLSMAERVDLVGLAFRVVPARHRIAGISEDLRRKIVMGRKLFRETVLDRANGRYVPFDSDTYIASLSIEDNLLFGKIRVDRRGARERTDIFLRETVADLGLRMAVARAALDFQVGVAGSRLTASQRRKLGLARVLMKTAPIVILDDLVDDDPQVLAFVRERCEGRTLVLGTSHIGGDVGLDRYYVMRDGRLVTEGTYADVFKSVSDEASGIPAVDEASVEFGEAGA